MKNILNIFSLVFSQEKKHLYLLKIAAISVLVYSLWLAIIYSNQPLLDWHSFRQTQTALTAFWMCKTGFKFAYETPVGGYPWSMPFEFPLYQYIVSKLACTFGFNLQQVGRIISYIFLLGCLLPTIGVLKKLFNQSWLIYFLIFTALFITSPLYLYWGRAFMIETTALFFTLCFLNYAISLIQRDFHWKNILLTALFFSLALLQKATTVLPLLAIIAFVYVTHTLTLKDICFKTNVILKSISAFVIPLILGYLWVHYTDLVKSHNPLGVFLTSKNLSPWNYGTLDMRFSKTLWLDVIWRRVIVENISGYFGCFVIALGVICLSRHEKKLILLSLASFIIYFLIFENLHYVHSYYQIANGIFLIASIAIALAGLLKKFPNKYWLILPLFFALIYGNLYHFEQDAYQAEAKKYDADDSIVAVSDFVRSKTNMDQVILVYGRDWSSEIAFFSQRKSFTVPRFFSPYLDPIENPTRYLQQKPAAILVCGSEKIPEVIQPVLQFFKPASTTTIKDCIIYLKE